MNQKSITKTNNYNITPNQIELELKKTEKELKYLLEQCKQSLYGAPEGKLRIAQTKNGAQYYHRAVEHDKKGIYIPKKNKDIANALAQKDYDEKLIHEINKQLKLIKQMQENYHPENISNILKSMNQSRQQLVGNHIMTDEEYINNWINQPYEKLGFDENDKTEYYDNNGVRVRSKAEIVISNMLIQYKIPCKYECPLYLTGLGTVYPDFTCLNVRKRKVIIYEHLGKMGELDYVNRNIRKIDKYIQNGYHLGDNFIITMETLNVPLSTRTLIKTIEKYLL